MSKTSVTASADITQTQGGGTEVLLLYNYLDEYEARDVARRLQHLPAGTGNVHVRIHSPGGEAFSGLALYNLLLSLRAQGISVLAYIDGLAASMAGIVAMAAQTIYMARNARLMIHNPWTALQGDGDTLRAGADELDKLRTQLAAIYAARSRRPEAEMLKLMDAETYLTAEEAMALGLVDEITESVLQDSDTVAQAAQGTARPLAVHGAYGNGKLASRKNENGTVMVHKTKNGTPVQTEGDTNTELDTLRAQLQQAEQQLVQLKEDLKLKTAERMVDVAVAEGRIAPLQREAFVLLALQNAAQVQAVFSHMPLRMQTAPSKSLRAQLRPLVNDRADWNLRDWEKRDPAGLQHMRNHEPTRYQALFAQTYGTGR